MPVKEFIFHKVTEKRQTFYFTIFRIFHICIYVTLITSVHKICQNTCFFPTRTFPHVDGIFDTVLITEKADQTKPVFWQILPSAYFRF